MARKKENFDFFDLVNIPKKKLTTEQYQKETDAAIVLIYSARKKLEKALLTSRALYEQMLNWADLIVSNEMTIKNVLVKGKYSEEELKSKLGLFLLNLKAFKNYLTTPNQEKQQKLYEQMLKLDINYTRLNHLKQAILNKRIKTNKSFYDYIYNLNNIIESNCFKVVNINMPFAVDMARKKCLSAMRDEKEAMNHIDDLIQVAINGIYTAAMKFEPSKNVKFITYAYYWICHEFSIFLSDTDIVIHPKHILLLKSKLRKIDVEKGVFNKPAEYYSQYLKEPISRIREAMKYEKCFSLNDLVNEEYPVEEKGLECLIDGQDVFSDFINNERKNIINTITSKTLSRRNSDILQKKFGLNNKMEMTLEEIGYEYNLSKERVRQIIQESISQILPDLIKYFGDEYEEKDLQKMLKVHSKEKRHLHYTKSKSN